jgi:hypothetical protein
MAPLLKILRHKLEYDLYYVKNYTPFLDILIILQTLRVVLWHEGAVSVAAESVWGDRQRHPCGGRLCGGKWRCGCGASAERFCGAGGAIVAALGLTALWCLAVAAEGRMSVAAQGMQGLRNLYLLAIYRMFASDATSLAQIGPVVAALALVDILVPLCSLWNTAWPGHVNSQGLYQLNIMLSMLGVVGSLVLVHNLYAGASDSAAGAALARAGAGGGVGV